MSEEATFMGWASYPIRRVCLACTETYDPEYGPECDCDEEEPACEDDE